MTARGPERPGRRRTRWWLLALIAVVVLVPAGAAAYLVTREPTEPPLLPFAISADGSRIDLGLPEGGVGMAEDVNADGTVVGGVWTADGTARAFLSRDGTMVDLGARRRAVALNDAGQVVGLVDEHNAVDERAFLWTDGVAEDLSADTGPLWNVRAIDDHGRVLGESRTAPRAYAGPLDDRPGFISPIGVLWEDGRATLLETADAMLVRVSAMDGAGAVLGDGWMTGTDQLHILLWRAGEFTDLGAGGRGIAMNDNGQIVLQKNDGLCYMWAAGRFTPLNGEDEDTFFAYDINGAGVVAGAIQGEGGQYAAVWQDGRITRLDLDSENSCAYAINDAGTVVGIAQE